MEVESFSPAVQPVSIKVEPLAQQYRDILQHSEWEEVPTKSTIFIKMWGVSLQLAKNKNKAHIKIIMEND